MDTDEAGEVFLEPEGTAVDTQKSCAYLKKCNTLFIRWGYTLECDRAFICVHCCLHHPVCLALGWDSKPVVGRFELPHLLQIL